jgi:AbiV family abortive infection protein
MALLEQARILSQVNVDGHDVWVTFEDHAQARTFALSVFAAEEVAKAYASSLILTFQRASPSAWESYWGIIQGHHRDKIQSALSLEQILPRLAGTGQDDLSRALQDVVNEDVFDQRNRALYVDIIDGALHTPDEFAKEPDVTRLREALRRSMATWAVILHGSLKRQLEEIDEEQRGAADWSRIRPANDQETAGNDG